MGKTLIKTYKCGCEEWEELDMHGETKKVIDRCKSHNKLELFVIEDGETHWLVANSVEDARQIMIDEYCADAEYIELVERVSPEFLLTIWLTDGYDETEILPTTPRQDGEGRWMCEATAVQWVSVSNHGDLIGSSVY